MNEKYKVVDQSLSSTSPLLQYNKFQLPSKSNGQSRFDPFRSPPNFEQAVQHGIAKRVCKCETIRRRVSIGGSYDDNVGENRLIDQSINVADGSVLEYCPCCKLPYDNEQMPLCVSLSKLAHLGVTFPLYFQFIKKCAFLLIVQFLLSGGYSMLINFYGRACGQQKIVNFICYSSLINSLDVKGGINLQIESVYNFVYLLVSIIIIEIFKVHQEVSRYEIEKHRVTPADFTIQISGFSRDMTVDEVENFVTQQLDPTFNAVEIVKIYFIFDMDPYTKLYRTKINLIHKRNKDMARVRRGDRFRSKQPLYEQRIGEIDEQLEQYEQILQDFTFKRSIGNLQVDPPLAESEQILRTTQQTSLEFSGRVLITLNDSSHSKFLVDKWRLTYYEELLALLYKKGYFTSTIKSSMSRFMYNNRLIKIARSAEPSDINWMNIGTSTNKAKKQLIINLLIIAIFCLSFGTIVWIKRIIKDKQHKQEYQSQLFQTSFAFIASTIVALTNTLIGICLRKFAGLETHKKHTKYYVSVGKSLSYLFFINMVCTTLFSNVLFVNGGFVQQQGYPFNLEGLMNDFFFLFITNTYLSSIFNYFDLLWGYRLLQRKRQIYLQEQSSLSQIEANQLFEGHPVDMALRYANVIKLMFFTSAVSPFLPIGLPMSVLGLLILYWVDKFLLLRRYVCHNYLDSQLADAMMNILPLCTVFYSFGNTLVMLVPILSNQALTQFQWPDYYQSFYFYLSFIGFLLSLVYRYAFQIPWIKKLYFQLFNIRVPQKHIKETYIQCKKYFSSDYESFHPVLREYYSPQVHESNEQQQTTPQLLKSIRQQLQ